MDYTEITEPAGLKNVFGGGQDMLRKQISILTMGTLLAASLAACAQPAENGSRNAETEQEAERNGKEQTMNQPDQPEAVTLTFLFGDAVMMDWFNSYFPAYISGENEDRITVETEYQKEANKVLQVKAAAGEIPDMVSAGLPQEMVNQGKFLDLSGEDWWDDLNPAAKELSTDVKSGKNYFVPMCMGAVGFFYNKDIFEELGLQEAKTWDEFTQNLHVIREKKTGVAPLYICGKEAYTFGHMIDFMVDGVAKEELGYVGFETAAAANDLDGLGWNEAEEGILSVFAGDLLQLQKQKLLNENMITASYDNQIEAFVTGKAAVISQGVWALADMQKKAPEFTSIGFAPYPAMLPDSTAIVGNTLDSYISISASSEHIDAARKVAKAMLEPDAIKSLCEMRSAIPANPSVDADWSIIKDDVAQVLSGEAVGVTFTQNLPGAFNGDERGRLVQELMVGKYESTVDFAAEYIKCWNEAYESIRN